ncbi:hypothetical protein ASE39_24855 [Acidovorax sp. Root267]|nr:hypothetical protein ASE39_24855 [Acidovorax sp. Root267]
MSLLDADTVQRIDMGLLCTKNTQCSGVALGVGRQDASKGVSKSVVPGHFIMLVVPLVLGYSPLAGMARCAVC